MLLLKSKLPANLGITPELLSVIRKNISKKLLNVP